MFQAERLLDDVAICRDHTYPIRYLVSLMLAIREKAVIVLYLFLNGYLLQALQLNPVCGILGS